MGLLMVSSINCICAGVILYCMLKLCLGFQGSAGPSDAAPLTGAVRKTCSSAVRLHLRRQHRCVCVCVSERERERECVCV